MSRERKVLIYYYWCILQVEDYCGIESYYLEDNYWKKGGGCFRESDMKIIFFKL